MGAAEIFEKLVVGSALLKGVQLAPVQVLQERVPQERVVTGLLDDHRNCGQTGGLTRPPSPLTHDQFVTICPDLSHYWGLE
ncbi:hypothetical protein GALL_436050 [mine drainage metagenome]|uniref:Uncharacterized protein n=1 Tax=mine drainage metagenome TaxID=410659 RepID=A0A1J5Q4A0_9ZZZZ